MPLVKLQTAVQVPEKERLPLMQAVSKAVAAATGKPEAYMMVSLNHGDFIMNGQPVQAAYADIRGIGGFQPAVNRKISKSVCEILETRLQIASDRVYITLTDVPGTNWGWKGATFA